MPRPPRLSPDSSGTRTNIAAAVRAGVAALPPSAARRLVLLSDGQENLDQAEPAAALAAAANVQIMTVPADARRGPEVLVRALDAPASCAKASASASTRRCDASEPTSAIAAPAAGRRTAR